MTVDRLMKQYRNISFQVFMTNISEDIARADKKEAINEFKTKMKGIEKKLNEQGVKIH